MVKGEVCKTSIHRFESGRRLHFLLVSSCAIATLGGCATFAPPPAEACRRAVVPYAGVVARAFDTTIERLRRLEPFPVNRWPALPADHRATLCYIDGAIGKAPPPRPDGQRFPTYDRAVVAIVDGEATMIRAGYRDEIVVGAP